MRRGFAIGLLLLAAQTAFAQDLELRRKPLDRRFPLSYCPFETRDVDPPNGAFGLFFTAIGPQATLHFEAPNQNSFGAWSAHLIDNIVVVQRSIFEANRGVPPGYGSCYTDTLPGFPDTGSDAPALFFNRFALNSFPFAELFDTTPAGDPTRPWDLTQGAYFLAQGGSTVCDELTPKPSSAPRNPEAGSDCTGGALGLGQESAGNIVARTHIPITGLVSGVEYIVTGWWDTNDFSLENALTVTVTAPAPAGSSILLALNDVAQSSGVDQLVRIPDLSTGVGVLVGSLGNGFVNSEAMAVQRTLQGDRIFVVDDDRLLQLDPATGNGTLIGPIGFPDVDGIAFHPTTGVLYGVTYSSSQLIRIDTATGDGTLVADDFLVSRRCNDIAFHPDGRCFVLTDGTPRIYQVNPATGAKLQSWILTGASSLEALLWSPDGNTLYSAADRGVFKDLVRINLAAGGVVSFVSSLHSGFRDLEGLAWVTPATDQLLAHWSSPTDAAAPRVATRLHPSVPNPFNPTTTLTFDLAADGRIELTVLDVAGRVVTTLASGAHAAGSHRTVWDGRNAAAHAVASGIYFAQLRTSTVVSTQRLVLVR